MTDCGTLIHADDGGRVATIELGVAARRAATRMVGGRGVGPIGVRKRRRIGGKTTHGQRRSHARTPRAHTPTQSRAHTHDSIAH